MARAREERVLAAWSGLGYYRRARALREGAVALVERHGGRLPRSVESLTAIPGIGRYTAGAIASVAFDLPAPIVDGNVKRVFSRWLAEASPAPRRLWELAEAIVPGPSPGDLNQALMELGATVCTPRAPRCELCPVARRCAGLASGDPERFPVAPAAKPVRELEVAVAVVTHRGRILLERRRADGPLRGAWDLPAREVSPGGEGAEAIRSALAADHGIEMLFVRAAGSARHSILDRRLRLSIYAGVPSARPASSELRWIAPSALGSEPVSGATLKVLRANGPGFPSMRSAAPKARSNPAP